MDWVDEVEIDDPNAVKPDDWDESQPRQIPDAKVSDRCSCSCDLTLYEYPCLLAYY